MTLAAIARADSVTLRNGDQLTGTIIASDEKDLTLETDFAGEIKMKLGGVKEVTSDKALYVVTS